MIVQFIKLTLDRIWKVHTRAFVYSIALMLLVLVQLVSRTISWQNIALAVLNAVLEAGAAMSAYEVIIKKIEEKLAAKKALK
ncbi:MAG: hypothetical protein WA125_06150 [Desulfosporosinus sp.]